MPTYTVNFTYTEKTRRQITVEADSPEEAELIVEDHELDFDNAKQIDCLVCEVSDAVAL